MLTRPFDDSSSDYGPDFTAEEEELVNELLAKAASEHAVSPTADLHPRPHRDQPVTTVCAGDIEDYEHRSRARSPKLLGREKPAFPWQRKTAQFSSPASSQGGRGPGQVSGYAGTASGRDFSLRFVLHGFWIADEETAKRLVEHPNSAEGRERDRERNIVREQEWTKDAASAQPDSRPPIERFRKPPNKAFSVTDLVSPAWCELQYWYALTKFGRKRRTPAMKQGSTIHKTLEDEIHTTVPVEVTTKEDAWALRIWNLIQGLRTLREYGTTRELEVWGLVDGELVNGVIDQLSVECPDLELEATAATHYAEIESSRVAMPEYQMSLTDYLLSPSHGGRKLSDIGWDQHEQPSEEPSDQPPEVFGLPRIYMTDVKTRGSRSVPTVKSTSFRPTLLQMQLYYHMLNRLVTTEDVTMETLANRYSLDPSRPFTDAFTAEVGGLNDQFFDSLSSQEFDPDYVPTPEDAHRIPRPSERHPSPSSSQDSTTILVEHNNLSSLWRLMKEQLRLTFLPHPSSPQVSPSIPALSQPALLEEYPTLLSPLLTARFISAQAADTDSKHLGSRSFLFDPTSMTSYLTDQMDWWRGQRDPRGVDVMDAWKCRLCDFRDECSWRQEKEWAFARRRRGARSSMASV